MTTLNKLFFTNKSKIYLRLIISFSVYISRSSQKKVWQIYPPLRRFKVTRMDHAVDASDLDPSLDVDVVFSKVDPTNGNVSSSRDWSHRWLKLNKNKKNLIKLNKIKSESMLLFFEQNKSQYVLTTKKKQTRKHTTTSTINEL